MTPEQHAERRTRIGGSDVAAICEGDWLRLWLQKTGREEPEDLSWILPVQIGLVTEPLNLAWFEHATGHQVFGRGEVYRHPEHQYIGTTIDGLVLIEGQPAIVQAKHVNAFSKIEEVERRYYGQVAHEMLCTGATLGFLSVFIGTQRHEIVEIPRNEAYTETLLSLEAAFWRYVIEDTPPPQQEPLAIPEKPDAVRVVDMAASNMWGSWAAVWLRNLAPSRQCDEAARELRALIEPDVAHAFGAGVEVKRGKDGRLYLREGK
jgi:predicted phage-related endonuclease